MRTIPHREVIANAAMDIDMLVQEAMGGLMRAMEIAATYPEADLDLGRLSRAYVAGLSIQRTLAPYLPR